MAQTQVTPPKRGEEQPMSLSASRSMCTTFKAGKPKAEVTHGWVVADDDRESSFFPFPDAAAREEYILRVAGALRDMGADPSDEDVELVAAFALQSRSARAQAQDDTWGWYHCIDVLNRMTSGAAYRAWAKHMRPIAKAAIRA